MIKKLCQIFIKFLNSLKNTKFSSHSHQTTCLTIPNIINFPNVARQSRRLFSMPSKNQIINLNSENLIFREGSKERKISNVIIHYDHKFAQFV